MDNGRTLQGSIPESSPWTLNAKENKITNQGRKLTSNVSSLKDIKISFLTHVSCEKKVTDLATLQGVLNFARTLNELKGTL